MASSIDIKRYNNTEARDAIKLSVLVCTIPNRKKELRELLNVFMKMDMWNEEIHQIEIITALDNKEHSIGYKRQKLLEASHGTWIVFFDDDDMPNPWYLSEIIAGIEQAKYFPYDCMNIHGIMTTNGENPQRWCHRYGEKVRNGGEEEEFDYYRPVIHFNPVLRSAALKAGFQNMRFGEDIDYSKRLQRFISKPYTIELALFHYRYNNRERHATKYGLRRR